MDEYDKGKRLRVYYTPHAAGSLGDADRAAEETELELEILHAHKPFTMSVVCHVRITSPSCLSLPVNLPATCIVKLYDRRYSTNYREVYDKGRPYSAAKELAYQALLRDEPQAKAVQLRTMSELSEEGDEAGLEAHIEQECSEMAVAEARAYEDMRELQGTLIPTLYGFIRYQSPHLPFGENEEAFVLPPYTARGMLIEYIPSVTLGNFLRTAMEASPPPYDAITEVCDQAMRLMDRIDDFNVLNDDVRLDNVLVAQARLNPSVPDPSLLTPLSPPVTYRCICIDFACTRLRYPDETDEQWRRAKECKDEQGAIGWVASKVLSVCAKERKLDVQGRLWRYPGEDKRSERWYRFYNDEEQAAYEKDTLRWGMHPEEIKRIER